MKYLATFAATLLILVGVLWPGSSLPNVGIGGIDKVAHFSLFVIWSIAVRWDFEHSFRWYWVLLAGLLFSLLTEILQIAAEGRSFDVNDLLADGAGLIFGLANGKFVLRILRRVLQR